VLDINTRCVRVQGFSPTEVLLWYNPASSWVQAAGGGAEDWLKEGLSPENVLYLRPKDINWHITTHEENGATAIDHLTRLQHRLEARMHPPMSTY
jgi:hypothetical protein